MARAVVGCNHDEQGRQYRGDMKWMAPLFLKLGVSRVTVKIILKLHMQCVVSITVIKH